jgi:non-specific serine/threonine protein kinase
MDHACRCGRVAQALRPAGYDAEAVYLVALLQNLGRLVVQYHFPEEAAQIRNLMLPEGPLARAAGANAGMDEEAAACAVLGIGLEPLGIAVARHWGLDETVLQMIRRLPVATPVRTPERDEDLVRAVASAANEGVDAALRAPAAAAAALDRVAHRYARPLGMSPKDLRDAMSGSR